MKYYKVFCSLVLCLFSLIIIVGALMFLTETVEVHFSTYKQLSESGLIAKGWIPSEIPVVVTNIFEVHKLDSNKVLMKFNLPNKSLNKFLEDNNFRKIKNVSEIIRFPVNFYFHARWWPDNLRKQNLYKVNKGNFQYELYSSNDNGYFAIDQKKSTVYFWK